MVKAILALLMTLPLTAGAQDLRDRALEQEKQTLEQQRQQQEKQRSVVEQQRPELSKPVDRKRDEKACESARINYQTSCGHPVAPKYRSPACRDAEVFIRQAC
jgi:membrane protein involved in colicin uptake